MESAKKSPLSVCLILGLVLVLGAAFARIHLRVQTTLIGYEIGKLKEYEAKLLKKRSLLTMELAKVSTRQNLEHIISQSPNKTQTKKTLAYQSSI